MLDFPAAKRHHWEKDKRRDALCKWFTEHHIDWQPCGSVANENSMISYQGEIYIDVPYDKNDPLYVQVRDYLENPDFWGKWAADF